MLLKPGRTGRVIVVASELDGIFLRQIASDLVNVLVLGKAERKPDMFAQELLDKASRILVALGNTHEGEIASPWWLSQYGDHKVRVLPCILGKNIFQSITNKQYIRKWIISDLTGDNPARYLCNYVVPSLAFKELSLS